MKSMHVTNKNLKIEYCICGREKTLVRQNNVKLVMIVREMAIYVGSNAEHWKIVLIA